MIFLNYIERVPILCCPINSLDVKCVLDKIDIFHIIHMIQLSLSERRNSLENERYEQW